tara:strand:- start:6081 stop:6920 length:840 start_codon:yes stop_codon:yes gene_type:complete
MSKVTFGYIVGGTDKHYENLLRSLRSLERIKQDHEILILDADGRLSDSDGQENVRIIHYPVQKGKGDEWFKPHIWKMRYHLYEFLETDYCIYMDTDTVIVNDRVDDLIEYSEDKFLICAHWWLNDVKDYFDKVRVSAPAIKPYLDNNNAYQRYIASGVFLFKKGVHDGIFKTFSEMFDAIFADGQCPDGITDELLLALSLYKEGNYKFANGSMNHSSNHNQMPLKLEDGNFYGKNPDDAEFEKVFLFHNDIKEFYTSDITAGLEPNVIKELEKVCYIKE